MTFKYLKSACQHLWREAKLNYTAELLNNIEEGKPKPFWNYIKSLQKDCCGVAPLKDNDTLIADATSKAEVLNKQNTFLFTDDDKSGSNIPNIGLSPQHLMT